MTDWTDIEDVTYRDDEPASVPCVVCGAAARWTWWEPPTGSRFSGRWCAPKRACEACEAASQRKVESARLQDALKACGVPERYREYRFGRWAKQDSGESWASFKARVLARPYTIGLTPQNHAIARVVRDWRPEHGVSLYIEGAVGTGKTLFGCCLARELLSVPHRMCQTTPEELRWQATEGLAAGRRRAHQLLAHYETHGDRVLPWGATGGYQVLWASEADLHNQLLAYYQIRNADPTARDPVVAASKVQVLIIDDVGTVDSDKWHRRMEHLIDTRYRSGRPVVLTSNLPWAFIQEHYGSARTADRLREMVPNPMVLDLAASWRGAVS